MQKVPQIAARKLGGRICLIPLRPGRDGQWLYELNETAAFIWESLTDAPINPARLAKRLAEEFEVALPAALADTEAVLGDLLEAGAIR